MILRMNKFKLMSYLAMRQMSVKQLAREAKIAYGTAYRAANGDGINVAVVGKICAVLGVNFDEIVDNDIFSAQSYKKEGF